MKSHRIRTAKYAVMTLLWTVAGALMLTGTVYDSYTPMFWSLSVSLGAAVLTGHLIIEGAIRSDRVHIERLLEGLIAAAKLRDAEDDCDRIH